MKLRFGLVMLSVMSTEAFGGAGAVPEVDGSGWCCWRRGPVNSRTEATVGDLGRTAAESSIAPSQSGLTMGELRRTGAEGSVALSRSVSLAGVGFPWAAAAAAAAISLEENENGEGAQIYGGVAVPSGGAPDAGGARAHDSGSASTMAGPALAWGDEGGAIEDSGDAAVESGLAATRRLRVGGGGAAARHPVADSTAASARGARLGAGRGTGGRMERYREAMFDSSDKRDESWFSASGEDGGVELPGALSLAMVKGLRSFGPPPLRA
jgi:hypothetical protein